MTYEEQLKFKRRKVENNLRRIGGLKDIEVPMTLGMEKPWRYRNKAQVPFGFDKGGICAGFYAGRTHTIIDLSLIHICAKGSHISYSSWIC